MRFENCLLVRCKARTLAAPFRRLSYHCPPPPPSNASPPPQTTVDDYAAAKSYLVNVTGGVETCQEYCPIAQEDIDLFGPFGIPDDAKDLGTATIEGVTAGAPPPLPPRRARRRAPDAAAPCPPLNTLSPVAPQSTSSGWTRSSR